ncbi:MAG TPA: hypothetical protein VII98_14135 [Solirubrobacteraceae bacterium]
MPTRNLIIGAVASAGLVAGGATALGAGAPDTKIAVSPHSVIAAPAISPIDAPGTPAVRKGKAIPSGYAIVVRPVSITPGSEKAGATFRMACPAGMRTRTTAGDVNMVGPYHTTYVQVMVFAPTSAKSGTTTGQKAYLVCKKA